MNLPQGVGDEIKARENYTLQMVESGMQKAEEIVETLVTMGAPIAVATLCVLLLVKYGLAQREIPVEKTDK